MSLGRTFLSIFQSIVIIEYWKDRTKMGCQPSNQNYTNTEMKICIIDESFSREENDEIRQRMQMCKIQYSYFISLQAFLENFCILYCHHLVTTEQFYEQLKLNVRKLGLDPKIYVICKKCDSKKFQDDVTQVKDYEELIQKLRDDDVNESLQARRDFLRHGHKQKINVKILRNPIKHLKTQQSILEAALNKANISFQLYRSFRQFEQFLCTTQCDFIVTDYIFHVQIIHLLKILQSKTKIICLCNFNESVQKYSNDVFTFSNNCLDVANFIKDQLEHPPVPCIKCTRVFVCTNKLQNSQQLTRTLQKFNFQVHYFNNYETLMKNCLYFFCVTVVCSQKQSKNLWQFLAKNRYFKVKVVPINQELGLSPLNLFKQIREIHKGYPVSKGLASTIDIVDVHYFTQKFASIKKQLQNYHVHSYGYENVELYAKNKMVISPFVICNYQERNLLMKHLEQCQIRTSVIVFCPKAKIDEQLLADKRFIFVSSHFGKIIKFIKKCPVYLPAFQKEEEKKFKKNIQKLKLKNKRISAIKWGGISQNPEKDENLQQNFQFLNISKTTNQQSIKQLQMTTATVWKSQTSIFDFQKFKQKCIESLQQLRKSGRIKLSEVQVTKFNNYLQSASMCSIVQKVKTFFDSQNQIGLEINKALLKIQTMDKEQIAHMREFLLLIFLNYYSAFQMPRISNKKLVHWTSNSLIQKCEIGSFLFSKNFMIFYESETLKDDVHSSQNQNVLGKYKIQIDLQYNTLSQPELLLNNFINYKDKVIFCPFSQFILEQINENQSYKSIKLTPCQSTCFVKYFLQINLEQSIDKMTENLLENKMPAFSGLPLQYLQRIQSLSNKDNSKRIQMHRKLLSQLEGDSQIQSYQQIFLDQLQFQLATFLLQKHKNKEAVNIFKDIIEGNGDNYMGTLAKKQVNDMLTQGQNTRVSQGSLQIIKQIQGRQDMQKQQINGSGEILTFDDDFECVFQQQVSQFQKFAQEHAGDGQRKLISQK